MDEGMIEAGFVEEGCLVGFLLTVQPPVDEPTVSRIVRSLIRSLKLWIEMEKRFECVGCTIN
jgi:hypothetical protein